MTELPREEWEVLIRGHHPGYITWEEYLANQAKLAANRTNAGARPPRDGTTLCQGIVFCGACGRSMQVRYQDRLPRYECGHSRADHVATPLCGSVRADTVDAVAADALLEAVAPDRCPWRWAPPEKSPPGGSGRYAPLSLAVAHGRQRATDGPAQAEPIRINLFVAQT